MADKNSVSKALAIKNKKRENMYHHKNEMNWKVETESTISRTYRTFVNYLQGNKNKKVIFSRCPMPFSTPKAPEKIAELKSLILRGDWKSPYRKISSRSIYPIEHTKCSLVL